MKPHRIRIAHELIGAYGMLEHERMKVVKPKRATPEAMTAFHTDEYIHFLSRVTPETAEEMTFHGTRFLVGDDNPAFEGVFEFCSISAGGSIAAASHLTSSLSDIAINWSGGLHHAKKREASGFCYINDIVLSILELLRLFPRVLYIDIDCHHGDGVEEAFYTSNRVMTVSFHKYGEYFPGTGTQEDRGRGKGKGYSLNVPLKDGMTDESLKGIFEPVMGKVMEVFRPEAVVLQCGADSLSGDKLGCFNVTMEGHAACVQFMRTYNVPLVLLGGGGYTIKNVGRVWAYETACALGIEGEIERKLPWNEYFEWFGPRYRLEVVASNMEDLNVKDGSLEKVKEVAMEQLRELECAPSVGMHDVPRESLGRHLGLETEDESREKDELDERLAQHARYVYQLQEPPSSSSSSSSSSEDEEDDYQSDESTTSSRRPRPRTRTRRKPATDRTRMSLLTNTFFDIPDPCANEYGRKSKRKFFHSQNATWDETYQKVLFGRRLEGIGSLDGLDGLNGFGFGYGYAVPVNGDVGLDDRERDDDEWDVDGDSRDVDEMTVDS
ncbi:hypothetical protein AAF712_009096 [Marasmius tenuissimus]|uniref:histone deacetylase n=1 Tax=Marasmius tenuissimus TaxID=585030 RepID=A0ABR2ZRJ6_9AGAR